MTWAGQQHGIQQTGSGTLRWTYTLVEAEVRQVNAVCNWYPCTIHYQIWTKLFSLALIYSWNLCILAPSQFLLVPPKNPCNQLFPKSVFYLKKQTKEPKSYSSSKQSSITLPQYFSTDSPFLYSHNTYLVFLPLTLEPHHTSYKLF